MTTKTQIKLPYTVRISREKIATKETQPHCNEILPAILPPISQIANGVTDPVRHYNLEHIFEPKQDSVKNAEAAEEIKFTYIYL